MIYRDLYCPECDYIETDVIFNSIHDKIEKKCPKCKTIMKNKCYCGSFELKYDNKKDMCGWGSDGYNSSQYYRESK